LIAAFIDDTRLFCPKFCVLSDFALR